MKLAFKGGRRFHMMLPSANHTDVNLEDMNPIVNAVYEFANDITPKYISQNLLKLCLELSHSAYNLLLDKYAIADWQDINIYTDNSIKNLDEFNIIRFKQPKSSSKFQGVKLIYQYAKHKITNNHYPKAFVASHKAGAKHVIAISIAGTGKSLNDWANNIDMAVVNSFHSGFYKGEQYLEALAKKLELPETAATMGLDKLSLYDVYKACTKEDSPFIILVTGHSKGAAITQILVQRLVDFWGVKAGNIIGVGFASPRVVNYSFKGDKHKYPLINILNNDDIVGRMAFMAQLGYCLNYNGNEAMRNACYDFDKYKNLQNEIAIVEDVWPKLSNMPNCLEFMYAYFSYLNMFAEDELDNFFALHLNKIKQLSNLYDLLPKKFVDGKLKQIKETYLDISNKEMPKSKVDYYFNLIEPVMETNKIKDLSAAFLILFGTYHSLVGRGKKVGPYKYIVNNGVNELNCYAWDKDCNKVNMQNDIIIGRKMDSGVPIPVRLDRQRVVDRKKRAGWRRG